mgnify:CR=1 FL=1
MTQKLYETDAYVQEFAAAVLSCTPAKGGYAVVLDRTAFFPEGGGQPCDMGTLGTAKVTDVHTDGTTITQLDKMVPFAQFNELMGLQKIRDIEHTYASSTGR